ncbi:hypothetical protein MK851_06420 [Tenacibaculum sp. 1B UA]|uniref:hypothetical protein n=1 Tax=Tenacibaculum sp. 1B UA TaxID=2922252 RepID=UPI002A23B870|nr:hypothetical protein [Tenacibaculum sp. 1B UA]MDX8553262.1 hypothetical protein [Tenacibaculum sp. 1B UA]
MKKLKKDFIDEVSSLLPITNWKKILINIYISKSKLSLKIKYSNENNQSEDLVVSSRYFKEFKKELYNLYLKNIESKKERFNKLQYLVVPEGNFEENYYWDETKEKEDKLTAAKYFYQWVNETMMNRIFEYEKENKLLTPNYDEEGDLIDYKDSWDSGIFTFKVVDKKIDYTIELIKGLVSRILPVLLPEYFINGLLEHHQITNEELKDEWQPWNTLVIKSPHNDIPYDSWEEYVTYSLER